MAFLRVANLKKSYKINKSTEQEVLKGVNLSFRRGELIALLGESGCGKSTLINILGGLDTDYTGSIVIKDQFIRDFSEEQMDNYRKKTIGVVFQNYQLISHMNLLENVEIAMSMSDIDKAVREERALDLLKLMGLDQYASKLPSQLSGGQKQRVAIARALANNPSIILADEPTGALDKESAEVIFNILKKISDSGKLVIIVTHSQKVADNCSRIVRIDDGVVVEDKRADEYKPPKVESQKEIQPRNIKTKEIINIAYRNLKQEKGRSFLVSCGMAVGIAVVILILCLSSGLIGYVNNVMVEEANSLNLTVTKSQDNNFTQVEKDMLALLSGISGMIENYAYITEGGNNTSYKYGDSSGEIDRVNSLYNEFAPDMLYGLLPMSEEIAINQSTAVSLTNSDISTLIGTTIELQVGTSDKKEVIISGIYSDKSVYYEKKCMYMPRSDLETFLGGSDGLENNILYITLEDATYINSVKNDLETMGYIVEQKDSSVNAIMDYIIIGTAVLIAVAAISLIVAAIMIFIVMHISIVERTKEIGIMRSIGARKKDIKRLFISESSMLGILGGFIGCLIVLIIGSLTNLACYYALDHIIIAYNPWYYLIGFISCIIISFLSGISPSINASELDPVEALRAE